MRVAFVVQRYGLEINGGAELHCRWVAEHMRRHWDVEVLTTRAHDYITWKNHYPEGTTAVNGVPVRRFSVTKARNPERFGRLQKFVFENEHKEKDELAWLDEEGPTSPPLVQFLRAREADYDAFVFFKALPRKSVLVPTAERDPVIHLKIFKDLFRAPRAFIYNSEEEREMIQTVSGNADVPGLVVGVGTEVPAVTSAGRFRAKHGILGPYIIYIGRIDENKGCPQLFDHFLRFKAQTGSPLKLVLIGNSVLRIPAHPDIVPLGFLPEEDKFDGLSGAQALTMPSFYESLSMVTLEAWALGRPVLANARCDVLEGQCRRSNGGLFYSTFGEFREALNLLLGSERLRTALGENGRAYYQANYTWDIIESKYLTVLEGLRKDA
jgi:glycosyltransferase involved in cell wall biosynthesis